MPTYLSRDELAKMVGRRREPSPWFRIDQERVDRFADATKDHQFIHVDPEKAARTPFGGTVAHGYLTLSLLPFLADEIAVLPENVVMGINYGLNKVRFPQVVRVGSEVRVHSKLLDVADKGQGRILMTSEATVEVRGEDKPALVAETLAMFVVGGEGA